MTHDHDQGQDQASNGIRISDMKQRSSSIGCSSAFAG